MGREVGVGGSSKGVPLMGAGGKRGRSEEKQREEKMTVELLYIVFASFDVKMFIFKCNTDYEDLPLKPPLIYLEEGLVALTDYILRFGFPTTKNITYVTTNPI